MGTEKIIHEEAGMEVRVWSNPGPVSLIIVPQNGYNVGDDEEATLEITRTDLQQLNELFKKAKIPE